MEDYYADLYVLESEIYKLKDFATINRRTCFWSPMLTLGRVLRRYEAKRDVFTSNNGGTAEVKLFRPLIQDEKGFFYSQ